MGMRVKNPNISGFGESGFSTTENARISDHCIKDRGKVSPESINIRTRDPASSENPDRRIKGGEVKSTRVSKIGTSGFGDWSFNLLTSRVAISRQGEVPIAEGSQR
jgi:hypothetical protein